MSNHLTSIAYKRNLGSLSRKAVMVLLADKASDDGSGIWASKQRMADEICASKQTVISVLKGLIEDGLIYEVGQRRCANGYTVEYSIDTVALEALPLVKWHCDQSNGLTGQAVSPVNELNPTSQAALPDQSSSLTQTPLNHPEPPDSLPENDFGVSDFIESWNAVAEECNLPKIRKLTPARRRAFNARRREYPDICDWQSAFRCLRTSKFLRGEVKPDWRADPDFFLQAKSFTKLVEGSYA